MTVVTGLVVEPRTSLVGRNAELVVFATRAEDVRAEDVRPGRGDLAGALRSVPSGGHRTPSRDLPR